MSANVPTKKRGRPALRDGEPSTPVSVRMAATDYDETYRRATRAGITMAEQIRRTLKASEEKDRE